MESLMTRFHKEVFEPYLDFLHVRYRFHSDFEHARRIWEEKLSATELINGPYLEKAQSYRAGDPIDSLGLHFETAETIKIKLKGRSLWKHQTEAIKRILGGKNTIIATGTSSGKTLCYQTPILDELVNHPGEGLRAIIIYPLNALVNDQLNEWEQLLTRHKGITFGRFTGQTPDSQQTYIARCSAQIKDSLAKKKIGQQELQQEIGRSLQKKLDKEKEEIPNRLNHRDAIRATPPNVLITNFSMLEYLLERPIDAPIFKNADLRFIVLDEVHAYRGVQATEIAFLIRRLKDRLSAKRVTCIATSATLGKRGDPAVRDFATQLFNQPFDDENPIYGEAEPPALKTPSISPGIDQYIQFAEALRSNPEADFRSYLKIESNVPSLSHALERDENCFRLRKDVLTRPRLLQEAAVELWPNSTRAQAKEGLQALLEIIAKAKSDQAHEDFCPTRLHYFIKTQDGFFVCLNKKCPAKKPGKPMFYVSRRNEVNGEILTEDCPDCHQSKMKSKLVEVVSCRKCGYFFGALHAQVFREGSDDPRTAFDSFTTELGLAADSFWSYFSVEEALPYPSESKSDKEDEDDLFAKPEKISWCVSCGRKKGKGLGILCVCEFPELREIEIFHRQRPSDTADNRYENRKKLLASCPNCGIRTPGIEPVKRFQESDDEMGLAMAIPFAHFQVSRSPDGKNPRKLLCFTDHRQRAATFPSHLEEETFTYDIGRKIIQLVKESPRKALTLVELGIQLFESTLDTSPNYDPEFFLPVSRHPEGLDPRSKDVVLRNLWVSEVFGYFSIPDAARESAEDFGLVAIRLELKEEDKRSFFAILSPLGLRRQEADDILQVLLGFVRQGKALTLPNGVRPDDPAFGSVTTADIYFVHKRDKGRNTIGWMPVRPHNKISDYLQRSLKTDDTKTLEIADQIWTFLISKGLFAPVPSKLGYKLIHECLSVVLPLTRFRCDRCKLITAYLGTGACPKKKCSGKLSKDESDANTTNVITRWLSKVGSPFFHSLTSEEHSAQINKDIAKKIEDEFRAEGVNLLSSTTTFEMGINIGDLQKVLLRNAPPSSANYIQRVGRAGRGIDKNAISITLCRRTKYDADAWNDPVRLMSGVVRAPSVFINNRVISQRHFNAVVFAKFLREELLEGQKLRPLAQQIPIAPFFPSIIRGSIPEKWFPEDTFTVFLDFEKWVSGRPLDSLFSSDPAATIASALGSVNIGRGKMLGKYKEMMEGLLSETQALLGERKKLLDEGLDQQAVSIMDAVKNLLKSDVISLLAKKGFLPRYAFPLDVVALETGLTRWSRDKDVDLSRDRGIAIAEFAPGAQVIAKKKVFTSEGLYVVGKKDEPNPEHFSQCSNCRQIRTGNLEAQLLGPCNVCSKPITRGDVKRFITPNAFSIRIDRKSGGNTTKYRPNTLIRQRQSLIHFIDKVDASQFRPANSFSLALVENGNLFRYNLGPGDQGFMVCPKCGCCEPMLGLKADHSHQRLRALSGKMTCDWKGLLRHISFGHTFESFCLIVRPSLSCPSIESLAYALQKGLCLSLEIETSDIGVSWRYYQNPDQPMGAEIILYDLAPGGAGFVRDAFQGWDDVLTQTQLFLKGCSCEKACYECLKNYSNQSFHEKLDRKKALQYFT